MAIVRASTVPSPAYAGTRRRTSKCLTRALTISRYIPASTSPHARLAGLQRAAVARAGIPCLRSRRASCNRLDGSPTRSGCPPITLVPLHFPLEPIHSLRRPVKVVNPSDSTLLRRVQRVRLPVPNVWPGSGRLRHSPGAVLTRKQALVDHSEAFVPVVIGISGATAGRGGRRVLDVTAQQLHLDQGGAGRLQVGIQLQRPHQVAPCRFELLVLQGGHAEAELPVGGLGA